MADAVFWKTPESVIRIDSGIINKSSSIPYICALSDNAKMWTFNESVMEAWHIPNFEALFTTRSVCI